MGEGLGVGAYRRANDFKGARQVFFDQFCGQPHKPQAQRFQQMLPFAVTRLLRFVNSSVHFDN
jgi:hypothetical protein